MKRKPVIAIDGYSSTGKSSISKIIAKKYDLIHLDTGALYRGIAWYGIQNFTDNNENIIKDELIHNLYNIGLEFKNENNELKLYLNNKNIEQDIRSIKVSQQVSFVAKQPEVRVFLLDIQRKIAEKGGVIMDGRDIGTVVLPNADLKFFLTASIDERTKRRYEELKFLGQETPMEMVKENLIYRDKIDSERETAPLKQAEDAILIDNTNLNKEQCVELISKYIEQFPK